MQIEYKNIDPKLVVNEIRNGRSLESVQKVFGLRFKSEVQDLYLKGLMELGEIPQVEFNRPATAITQMNQAPVITVPQNQDRVPFRKRERQRQPVSNPTVVIKTGNFRTIGQSGSVTLNKALLIEMLGFKVGDSFEIYREDDMVVLKKSANPL
ncbi:MAG: AbrB/MazE/SpoVT family DNA-binding domain-containing protein [Syntrophobacteraceae bacterium]|nr:AbrB/MazE/SpoVT family DNA-binding domain-containing protein [Syntrophobacteraceae bacterium]